MRAIPIGPFNTTSDCQTCTDYCRPLADPCDNLIASFFGKSALAALDSDPPSTATLRRQMYQCMLSQALFIKTDIESRRARNVWGLLLWQATEIWPT